MQMAKDGPNLNGTPLTESATAITRSGDAKTIIRTCQLTVKRCGDDGASTSLRR